MASRMHLLPIAALWPMADMQVTAEVAPPPAAGDV